MKTLGFLAVYVALYLSGVTGYGRSKEGKCPPPPKAVNCARRMFTSDATPCFYQDLECPGTQKCCDDGCDGKACVLAIGLPKLPVVEPCNFKGSTTSAGGECRAKNVTYCSKFGCKECCIHTSTCSPLPGVYIKRAECEKQLCKDESCPGQGQICVMDKYHRASCVCRQQCPKNFKGSRVCGSDKVTYENECRMNITACVLGVRINVIFPGPCDQRNENPLAICDLAKDPGHGDMRYLRYYFHKKKGICEAFIYYGKKGNRNNFKNFQDCDDRCSKAVKDVCVLPKVVGSCRAAFPRWYFNTRSGLCERFTYGGCAGNANNFRTREQCEAHCGAIPEKNICDLPKAKGRCKGKMRRWFYNKASGKCQWFNYGGCGGNENNFKILRECRIACAGGFGFGRRVVNPFVPRCEDGSKFTCRSIKKCIPVAKRCNGKNDCGDNSDEENCKPVVKDPCYGVTCDFYATCVSTKNGTVLCECPKICPPVKSPVCGSDNETYPNLCTMKVQSCEKQQLITKKSDGECATGTRTKCQEEYDSTQKIPGAFVVQCEDDGSYSEVQCHSSTGICWCVDQDGVKVDGTEALRNKPNCTPPVTVTTTKPFDICEITLCDFGKCVNINGTATCQCDLNCPRIDQPLCGSDNNTYPNLCVMEAKACETKQFISVKHDGPCDPRPKSPCELQRDAVPQGLIGGFRVQCEEDGSYSKVQCHAGTGYCWCVDEKGVKLPGTDIRSQEPNCYGNKSKSKCEKERDSVDSNLVGAFKVQCEEDGSYSKVQCHGSTGYCWCVDEQGRKLENTAVRHRPNCSDTGGGVTCDDITCKFYSTCITAENGTALCQCPQICTADYNPVCGSDKKTYPNLCGMRVESCKKLEMITKKSDGKCDPCEGVSCDFHASCVPNDNGTALCECPKFCTFDYSPVCGSDNKTYSNLCAMKSESCEKQQMITKQSDGECVGKDPCEGVSCEFYATCVALKNGSTTCQCPQICTKEYNPVCGSDNKTYSTECIMKVTSCEKQELIVATSYGECPKQETFRSRPILQPVRNVTAYEGDNVTVVCKGSTFGPAHFQWLAFDKEFKKTVVLKSSQKVNELCLPNVSVADQRWYTCMAANVFGYDSRSFYLHVLKRISTSVTEPSPEPIPKQKSKCQKEVEALPDPTPPGTFVPQCEADGSYSKAQCDGSTAYCWCVDEQGAELEGTRLRFKEPNCTDVEQKTICERRRDSDPLPSPGKFVPQCDQDGSYSEIQCHGSTGYCWCVDELGNTREGTEVRLKKPNCEDPCKNVSCKFYATCVALKNGSTTCQCPEICTFEYNPVCGSNNRTYATECVLKVDSCEKQELIMVKSYGECPKPDVIPTISPCATVQCKFHSQCKLVDGKAKCVCHKGCTREYDPKCGSDGVTYSNPCELRRAACEQMKDIAVAKNGECEITPTVSPCESVKCGFYSQCKVVDGKAKCVCHKGCTREYDPKCGSDGVTYSNPCELRKAACEQMTDITVAKNGKCEKPNVAAVLPQCTTCPISLPQKVEKRFRNSYSKFVITGEVVDVRRDESREEMEISVNISKRYKPRNPGKANLKKRDVVKIKIRKLKQGCRCDNLNFEKNVNYVFMGKWKKDKTLVVSTKYGFVQKATDDVVARLKKAKKRSYQRRNYRG